MKVSKLLTTALLSTIAITAMGAVELTSSEMKALGLGGKTFTKKSDNVWTVKGGVTVYSSQPYGAKIRGFAGSTPVFIAVGKGGKIISVAAAPNRETPSNFGLVRKQLLKRWKGKTLKQAATWKPDVISGATYSSNAVIRTVQATAAAHTK